MLDNIYDNEFVLNNKSLNSLNKLNKASDVVESVILLY